MELTPQQEKKLKKISELSKHGDLAITAHLFEIEDRLDQEIPQMKDVILRMKGDKGDSYIITEEDKQKIAESAHSLVDYNGITSEVLKNIEIPVDNIVEKLKKFILEALHGDTPSDKHLISLIKPLILEPSNGKDGLDADEEEIVRKIELDLPKFGEQFRDGLELLEGDQRLEKRAIKGFDDYEEISGLARASKLHRTASALYTLSDVNIGGITNGQALVYNSASNSFIPGSISASITSSDSSLTIAGSDAIINVAKATTWTAKQKFRAGAIGAGTAGVYLQSGSLMTTPEVGAIEFLTDKIYGTITTGGARKEFTLNDIALTSGRVPFATTNGRLTDSSGLNFSGSTLSLGVAASAAGVLTFFQSTGIQTTSITPSSSGSSINFILPNSGGTPGYPMVTNGSGALSFAVLGVAAGGTGSSVQLTQGSIVFAGASGVYTQDNPNLTWDSVGKKLTAGFDSSNSVTIAVGATGVISLDALGSGAKFSFLDDVETTKNFLLPTTTSTVGQIKINGNATFHTYGTGNLFIGYPSGNFTQTGIGNNVGLGINTLTSVTSGSALLAIGSAALQLATGATNSMGLGVQTFNALLTGTGNVAIGYTAAASLSVTNYATIIGASAALNATGTALAGATLIGAFSGPSATGAGNTLVGFSSGRGEGDKGSAVALTIGTYNTLIGYDSDVGTNSLNYAIALGVGAVVNASNTMAIGSTNATYAVRVGINMQTASAYLHLPAGLATAGFAPLKFTSGTVQTTAQAGVMEYNGNHYLTNSAIRFGVGGSLSTNTTSVGNIGIGEDDLMTYTVIANTLAVDGGSIRGRASGTITSNVNAKRLRVRFGATLVLDTGVAGIPVSQAIQWVLEFEIIRTGALTQKCSANLSTNNASLASYVGYSTAAETLSGAVVVKVTGEATTNNDVVQETMTVKFVPAPQA